MLDSDKRLWVTIVSPPIFGAQNCGRFCTRMQLNMGGLQLNTDEVLSFSFLRLLNMV